MAHPSVVALWDPSSWPSAGSVWPFVQGSHSYPCHHLGGGRGNKGGVKLSTSTFIVLHTCGTLPLKSPLIPPIFLTMAEKLAYCFRSSFTSRILVPAHVHVQVTHITLYTVEPCNQGTHTCTEQGMNRVYTCT